MRSRIKLVTNSMDRLITLAQQINVLCNKYGGFRKTGRVLQIDSAYLYRLYTGEKTRPSKKTQRKLGVIEHILYFRTNTKED